MEKFIRAFEFIRLLDKEGNISLTNVALVVALVKIALMPAIALPELAAFLGTVAAYQVRRAITMTPVNAADENAAIADAVKNLETKVSALQLMRK